MNSPSVLTPNPLLEPLLVIAAPNPRLRVKSSPVLLVDDDCRLLMDRMLDLVRAQNALGLAAVQIGADKRVVVVNVGVGDQAPVPRFLVNPEIIRRSRQRVISEESCLSIPGYVGLIQRSNEVTVRFLDYHGRPADLQASGLLAVCIQHEIDHLDGRLFTDHLSLTQRLSRRWDEFRFRRDARQSQAGHRQKRAPVIN